MVQLEEVEDQDLSQAQPGPAKDEDYDSADFVDTDSELSDEDGADDETSAPQETLSERLTALRDIIPPPARRRLSALSSSLYSLSATTLSYGGKGLWIFSTGAMMLMVPFAIAFVEEQQIVEQEHEMKAREGLAEGLTPGVAAAGMAGGGGAAGGGRGMAL